MASADVLYDPCGYQFGWSCIPRWLALRLSSTLPAHCIREVVSMKLILTCQSGGSNDNSIFWHRGIYIRCRADKLPYLVVLFLSCRIDLWSWPTHCPRGQRLALMHSIQKHTLSKYTRKAYRYGTLYLCVRRRNTIISSHATS